MLRKLAQKSGIRLCVFIKYGLMVDYNSKSSRASNAAYMYVEAKIHGMRASPPQTKQPGTQSIHRMKQERQLMQRVQSQEKGEKSLEEPGLVGRCMHQGIKDQSLALKTGKVRYRDLFGLRSQAGRPVAPASTEQMRCMTG